MNTSAHLLFQERSFAHTDHPFIYMGQIVWERGNLPLCPFPPSSHIAFGFRNVPRLRFLSPHPMYSNSSAMLPDFVFASQSRNAAVPDPSIAASSDLGTVPLYQLNAPVSNNPWVTGVGPSQWTYPVDLGNCHGRDQVRLQSTPILPN